MGSILLGQLSDLFNIVYTLFNWYCSDTGSIFYFFPALPTAPAVADVKYTVAPVL